MALGLGEAFESGKSVACRWLKGRGIDLMDLAELVHDLQADYLRDLTVAECLESLERVLEKREVQNAVMTGLYLDMMAEKGMVPDPLGRMLTEDDGLYGIDEILVLSILNIYGSIGLTNFGYLDKVKPGVIGRMANGGGRVNTFADDIVCALVAAAASRLAHRSADN